jgi:DNA-binding NarL/FixJ family response regulator
VSVGVIHPEPLSAEAILAALVRYPGVTAAGHASSTTDGVRLGARASVVIVHADVMGVKACVRRLQRMGVRVILLGEGSAGAWRQVPLTTPLEALVTILSPSAAHLDRRLRSLTSRERDVLELASEGLAGKQIARRLEISPKTVERHKTRIYSKLGVSNQAAAASLVARHPLASGEQRWNLSSM